MIDLAEANERLIDHLDTLWKTGKALPGLPTGFPDLDWFFGGFIEGELAVIAGTPEIGTTTFAVAAAMNTALKLRQPTLLYSFDVSEETAARRVVAASARIPLSRLQDGRLRGEGEWSRLARALSTMTDAPMAFDSAQGFEPDALDRAVSEFSARHERLGLLLVDGLAHDALSGCEALGPLARLAAGRSVPVLATVRTAADPFDPVTHKATPLDARNSAALVMALRRRDNEAPNVVEVAVERRSIGYVGHCSLFIDRQCVMLAPLTQRSNR